MAGIACVLFVGTAFSQTQPQDAAPRQTSSEAVANPFATPWLLKPAPISKEHPAVHQAEAQTSASSAAGKYTLTPDPFSSTLANDSAVSNNPAPTAEVITHRPETPEPITNEVPATIKQTKPQAKALSAKYDISRIGDRGVGKKLNFYSVEKEEALGRELSLEVEQHAKLLSDPVITEYVNRIGQTLVRHSDAQVPFTIKVVDDEQVNAFALPGGFFYVNSGLILAADNEAELAGVMAHEIAHVAARHATRNATKQDIWNLASLPLIT
jgi:hypothetical protein